MPEKPLNQKLLDEPYRFEFFQAVRLLEKMYPERRAVGREASVTSEVARFRSRLSLDFPASEIHELLESTDEATSEQKLEMFVNFMGMIGVSGVMPTHYTELAMDRKRYRDTAMWSFMDIFTHRTVSMFFRAWEKYRFPVGYERGADDFTAFLFDLVGLGTSGLRGRMDLADESLLPYGGLIAQKPHSAIALGNNSEDSRYVGLTLPHVLGREPYGAATRPTESFSFEEDVDGTNHKKYLWSNAAYALGTRLTEAFSMHGWCVAIRGVEGGGLVQGLPTHTFETDEGEVAAKCPTEVAITDRREKEFSDNGFIPLVHCKNTDYAAFFATQSACKAKKYDTDEANANARLSNQLQYLFAVSRFAHYLKSMMRDKIGSFMSRSDCERFLNRWINNYVTPDDSASQSVKAKFPLREARIEVAEVPGKPGAYRSVAFLRPHFQLDELSVSLRLVADLPAPLKGR